jgi:hypothetical protein
MRTAAVFFDSLGRILVRSSEVLRTEIRPQLDDEFLAQQVDAIALIVGEVGAAWPELFGVLERTNELLDGTLREVAPDAPPVAPAGDQLARNGELLIALDAAVQRLHDAGDQAALARLRGGLRAAAELEQDLLSRAVERSGMAATRRL